MITVQTLRSRIDILETETIAIRKMPGAIASLADASKIKSGLFSVFSPKLTQSL